MRALSRLAGASPLPDRWAVALQFRLEMGRWPDLKAPRTFNEHLCAAKLDPGAWGLSRYVDKLAAREAAAAALGAGGLVPLVGGPWERGEQVPAADLPPCALKCTHASHAGLRLAGPLGDAWSLKGGRQVCALKDVGRVLDGWLKRDWYRVARERPYRRVRPRIIAERWIDGAVDYKVMVFGGRAKIIQRHGMEGGAPTLDLYGRSGAALEAGKAGLGRGGAARLDAGLAARLCLAAERVAAQVRPAQDYLRVDFLADPAGKAYFGEITFYDSAGLRPFQPEAVENMLGRWLNAQRETQGF